MTPLMTNATSAMSKPPPSRMVMKAATPPQDSVATQRGYGCGAEVIRSSSVCACSAPMCPRTILRTSFSVSVSRV